jgi:hypothetical protein
MSQGTPVFIQACEAKVYGNKIWINLNAIVSFGKDVKFNDEGQWYKIVLVSGALVYTTYNLASLSTYSLPAY